MGSKKIKQAEPAQGILKKEEADDEDERDRLFGVMIDRFAAKLKSQMVGSTAEKVSTFLKGVMSTGEFWRLSEPCAYNKIIQRDLPMRSMFSILGTDFEIEDMMRGIIKSLDGKKLSKFEDSGVNHPTLNDMLDDLYDVESLKISDLDDLDFDEMIAFRRMIPKDMIRIKGRGTANTNLHKNIELAEKTRLVKETDKLPKDKTDVDVTELG